MMDENPTFSIIINNYGYGRFLRRALESCLEQTYSAIETIVVDDGSTDDSRSVIESFGDAILPLLKSNGGQASAYNAGFAVSTGDLVLFLDADDSLRSDAVSRFVEGFKDAKAAKVQSRMTLVDARGESLGAEEPAGILPSGDWKEKVLRYGPSAYPSTPSSASAYTRRFLEQVLPMPEEGYRVAADGYLKNIAPLFGTIVSLQEPLVNYRLHGSNTSHWGWQSDPRGRFTRDTAHYELACEHLARWATRLGDPCDPKRWSEGRWQHLARKQVLFRLGGADDQQVPLGKCLKAGLDGSVLTRPAVLAAILLIYCAPVGIATQLVLRLFRKKKIGEGIILPTGSSRPAGAPSPDPRKVAVLL